MRLPFSRIVWVTALLLSGGDSVKVNAQAPYTTSADFEKYARMLREKALLKLEPVVVIPVTNRPLNRPRYPWKNNIVTTLFAVGEGKDGTASSWDSEWSKNFGGFDNPSRRQGFLPAGFIPQLNPFYFALPYNDVQRGGSKLEARTVIPWFEEEFQREGQSVCRDRWLRIRNHVGKDCYAQWSDCGPRRADHWQYVFGDERPKPNPNQSAGLSISPAVRDYLGLSGKAVTDWQFVDLKDIPRGPWSLYGDNNPFVQEARRRPAQKAVLREVGETEPTVKIKNLPQGKTVDPTE